MSYALGGWSGRVERRAGKQTDGNRERWKPDITAMRAVIQFVKATGRFQPLTVPRAEEGKIEREDEKREGKKWR